MPEIKDHLKNVSRVNDHGVSRRGFIRLDMNEGVPGPLSGFIKETLKDIDDDYLAMYPAYNSLIGRIAKHDGLKEENICISNGSDAAIKYLFDAYVSAGDKVLLTDPAFAMYLVYCRMYGATPVAVKYGKDLKFPYRAFYDKLRKGIKMAVIVNPNNPTGSVLSHGEIMSIIKRAARNDILTVVDEAYFYFYPDTVIREIKKFDNLVVLRTFSKLCGLASLRLGYAAASPGVITDIGRVKPTYDVNGIAVFIADKLLSNKSLIPTLIKTAVEGKEYLVKQLAKSGIDHVAGHANFVLIKCPDAAGEIGRRLKSKGILVHHGFTQPFLKDYLRVTTGDRSVMKKFWDSFIKEWKEQV